MTARPTHPGIPRRALRQPLAYMLLGVVLCIVLIALGVAARGESLWSVDRRHGWLIRSFPGEGYVEKNDTDIIAGEDETKLRIDMDELPILKQRIRQLERCSKKYWEHWLCINKTPVGQRREKCK